MRKLGESELELTEGCEKDGTGIDDPSCGFEVGPEARVFHGSSVQKRETRRAKIGSQHVLDTGPVAVAAVSPQVGLHLLSILS